MMMQSGGFLGRLIGPLLKTGLPLMKNLIKPLAKSILIPLGLTAASADAGMHKKILESGHRSPSSASHNDSKILVKESILLPYGLILLMPMDLYHTNCCFLPLGDMVFQNTGCLCLLSIMRACGVSAGLTQLLLVGTIT